MSNVGNIDTEKGSEYNQLSFIGGMNLLGDDTRLDTTQYRVGFDLTNRYDSLDPVLQSVEDTQAPQGLKQECVTFGLFVILFVAGTAWYRSFNSQLWTEIIPFRGRLSSVAPRYWSISVPLATTNYYRVAATTTGLTGNTTADSRGVVQALQVAGAAAGNIPGLLVQDNINQPVFIFLDGNGIPTCRITQTFAQWSITFTSNSNAIVAANGDKREYVPIGNCMAWTDGILYIVSQDFSQIYRSVSGRPLDFMVNVSNLLVTTPWVQTGGGDASTTAYSVGVGGITCIRPLSTGGIFVSASGANFAVTLDKSNVAVKIFGEFTFDRAFLFASNCLSDRVIFDSIGDTRFIELTGIKSFNAIKQSTNEGNNSPFSATIHGAFGPDENPIIQDFTKTAAVLFNDYELYSVNTIFGPAIAKYDTLNNCWVGFDKQQTGGKAVKIFAKIELSILRLFAITEDDRLFTLYIGPETTTPYFRTGGICFSVLYAGRGLKIANPRIELKMLRTRVILNKITKDCTCTFTPFSDNRLGQSAIKQSIIYESPAIVSNDPLALQDVNTQLSNLVYPTPDVKQAWKYFATFSWSGGSFVQFSMEMDELTPNLPNTTEGTVS